AAFRHGARVCTGWGRCAGAVEFGDRFGHERMGGRVVVVRADHFHDVGDGVLGHQHPAEDALFRSQVVRRSTLELPAAGGEFGDTHGDPPPRLTDSGRAPLPRFTSVLADGADSLLAVGGPRPIALCTGLWTACAHTPLSLCAGWGCC